MIKEDYVSFEVAKLLKDKGFNEHCFCINYPLSKGGHHSIILPNLLNNSMIPFIDEYKFCRYKEDFITIPTLQMAMKWLRKVHNLHVDSSIYTDTDGDSEHEYTYTYWDWLIFNSESGRRIAEPQIGCGRYDSYEQACEAAIKYCLEHLI